MSQKLTASRTPLFATLFLLKSLSRTAAVAALAFLICSSAASINIVDAAGQNGKRPPVESFGGVAPFDKSWGRNIRAQLGIGNTIDQRTVPQTISGFSDITAFGGGGETHALALLADGTVVTTGRNFEGQLGDGTNNDRTVFGRVLVAAGGANLSNVVRVSSGGFHNLALKADGTVWSWGYGLNGELGNGGFSDSNVPVQVGANVAGFAGQVVSIDAGYLHSLAVTADGKVWAWGINDSGQLGDGTTQRANLPQPILNSVGGTQLSGVIAVSAGEKHSVALKNDGGVLVWGNNNEGEAGNNTAGANVLLPTAVNASLMGAVTSISAGANHTAALKADGTVWVWGAGDEGEIGDGGTTNALVPRQTAISNAIEVRADNGRHNLARTTNGSVFAWGRNADGEIGNGTQSNQLTPLNISLQQGIGGNLGANVVIIGAGRATSFAAIPAGDVPVGANVRVEGDNVRLGFANVTAAGGFNIYAIDPSATGLNAPAGYTILANSPAYEISTSAAASGSVVCLKVPIVVSPIDFNRLFVLHDDDGDGTLDGIGVVRNYQKREICRTAASFSPFVLASNPAGPTAATVTVGGRITLGKRGITNVRVTLTNANGATRIVLSSQLGYYRFAAVEAGQTYTISVAGKKYSFANSVQLRSIFDDTDDVDFQADN